MGIEAGQITEIDTVDKLREVDSDYRKRKCMTEAGVGSAHSGIEYNELTDKPAKNFLLEKGYKTYDNGSIYFVSFQKGIGRLL